MRVLAVLLPGAIAACGGAASRDPRPSAPPGVTGGEGGDESAPVGGGATTEGGTGATAGGASSGASGGANAGSGGSSSTPNGLLLPAGCEPRARTQSADACSLAVYCDTASLLTNCWRLGPDRFRCHCDPIHPERVYDVEGASGLDACALAAVACSEKKLELGDEVCDDVTANSPQGDCSTELACGRPIELGVETDARISLMHLGSATCTAAGDFLDCRCTGDDVESRYSVLVEGRSAACLPLAEFCLGGTTPEYDGEEECFLTDTTSNAEGCERGESCIVPMSLTDDVRIGEAVSWYANCAPFGNGGSECYCSTPSSSFGFRRSEPPTDATCESSLVSCREEVVLDPASAATCEPTLETFSGPTRCDADLDCFRSATVGDQEILAKGRLVITCGRVEESSAWWCACASDQKTARFELGAADSTPTEACQQAPAVCIDSLPVQFGPYGDFVYPPDPLP